MTPMCLPLVLAALLPAAGAATREALVTDRPDFTESAVLVPVGRLQLEFGATMVRDHAGVKTVEVGEALFRWGVLPRLELRLQIPSWQREAAEGWRVHGFGDPEVGVKVPLPAAGAGSGLAGADWALVLSSSVPTGANAVSAGVWQPSAILAVGWEPGGTWSFGANAGVSRESDSGRRFTGAWLSSAAGIEVGGGTQAFAELIAFRREKPGGPATLTFQTGLSRRYGSDFQVDVRLARRVTGEGPNLLMGVGAGVRW